MTIKSILIRSSLIALLSLGGCATERLRPDVVRFHNGFAVQQGQSISIQPVDPALKGSLEFATYANLLSERLARLGFRPVTGAGPADLVAELAYGQATRDTLAEGGRSPVNVGVGVGGGSGNFGLGGSINFPIGRSQSENRGMRDTQLSLRIKRSGDAQPLWEGRATAEGLNVEANSLTNVMPTMMDAVLSNFPGENGKTQRYTPPSVKK